MIFYGVGGVAGRLVGGGLLDRFSKGPWAMLPTSFLPSLAALVLIVGPNSRFLLAFVPLFVGLAAGLEVDIVPYFSSRYFGLKNFGAIYASLSVFFVIGNGMAPLLGSMAFDHFGSYHYVLIAVVIAGPVAALLLGLLGSYPDRFTRRAG